MVVNVLMTGSRGNRLGTKWLSAEFASVGLIKRIGLMNYLNESVRAVPASARQEC